VFPEPFLEQEPDWAIQLGRILFMDRAKKTHAGGGEPLSGGVKRSYDRLNSKQNMRKIMIEI
jgi:hypothetical protein